MSVHKMILSEVHKNGRRHLNAEVSHLCIMPVQVEAGAIPVTGSSKLNSYKDTRRDGPSVLLCLVKKWIHADQTVPPEIEPPLIKRVGSFLVPRRYVGYAVSRWIRLSNTRTH